jgi:hypothetical protein
MATHYAWLGWFCSRLVVAVVIADVPAGVGNVVEVLANHDSVGRIAKRVGGAFDLCSFACKFWNCSSAELVGSAIKHVATISRLDAVSSRMRASG